MQSHACIHLIRASTNSEERRKHDKTLLTLVKWPCISHVSLMYFSCIFFFLLMYVSCISHAFFWKYVFLMYRISHVFPLFITLFFYVYMRNTWEQNMYFWKLFMYFSCIYFSCISHVFKKTCISHVSCLMYFSCI